MSYLLINTSAMRTLTEIEGALNQAERDGYTYLGPLPTLRCGTPAEWHVARIVDIVGRQWRVQPDDGDFLPLEIDPQHGNWRFFDEPKQEKAAEFTGFATGEREC